MGECGRERGIRPFFIDFYNYPFYTPFLFFALFAILYLQIKRKKTSVLQKTQQKSTRS